MPLLAAEHGSKLLDESTTAQTSPLAVSFASRLSTRLVRPELAVADKFAQRPPRQRDPDRIEHDLLGVLLFFLQVG